VGQSSQFQVLQGGLASTLVVTAASTVAIGAAATTNKLEAYLTGTTDGMRLNSSADPNSANWVIWQNDAQVWMAGVQADETFEIQDVTTGTIPFAIEVGAGNNTLVVDSNSRVGIGTAAPGYDLEVLNSAAACAVEIESGIAGAVSLYLHNTAREWRLVNWSTGTVYLSDVTAGTNPFTVEGGAGTNTLVVDNNSRVGIGTAAPTTKIEMSVVTADYFTLKSTGVNSTTGFQLANDAQSWLFVVNTSDIFSITDNTGGTTPFVIETGAGNDTLVVDSNSRVGIGTNAPSHELHVTGSSGTESIMLEDTSANSVPQFHIKNDARDWYLDVAGAGGGSNDEFRIVDGTAGTAAFVIKAAAPTNAFIINNTSSEVLTLTSTTAALLLPRMTTAQMNAIAAPVNGMIIYNTTVGAVYGYEAGAWANL
jgi:hypothetical protein